MHKKTSGVIKIIYLKCWPYIFSFNFWIWTNYFVTSNCFITFIFSSIFSFKVSSWSYILSLTDYESSVPCNTCFGSFCIKPTFKVQQILIFIIFKVIFQFMNKNKWLYSGTGYVRQAAKKGGSIKHYFWVKLNVINSFFV